MQAHRKSFLTKSLVGGMGSATLLVVRGLFELELVRAPLLSDGWSWWDEEVAALGRL